MERVRNLAEYQLLAVRTVAPLESADADHNHMVLGITTEVSELLDIIKGNIAYKKPLDTVHIGEEIADICWYIGVSAYQNGYILKPNLREAMLCKESLERPFAEMLEGLKADPIKLSRFLYSNLSLTPEMFNSNTFTLYHYYSYFTLLQFVAEQVFGLDFYGILTTNIEKLKVRYPEKFTEHNATNRDLSSERKVLEKSSEKVGK